MKNANYVYSTSEVSSYYGLTGKGLAFYEEKGIIAPKREQNNKYRVFSLDDCYSLYHSKLYSNCEFTLGQTVNLLKKTCTAGVEHALREKAQLMRSEGVVQGAGRGLCGTYRMCFWSGKMRQPFLRSWSGEKKSASLSRLAMCEHISDKAQSEEFAKWNQTVPINVASLKYSRQEIESGLSEPQRRYRKHH